VSSKQLVAGSIPARRAGRWLFFEINITVSVPCRRYCLEAVALLRASARVWRRLATVRCGRVERRFLELEPVFDPLVCLGAKLGAICVRNMRTSASDGVACRTRALEPLPAGSYLAISDCVDTNPAWRSVFTTMRRDGLHLYRERLAEERRSLLRRHAVGAHLTFASFCRSDLVREVGELLTAKPVAAGGVLDSRFTSPGHAQQEIGKVCYVIC